MFWIATAVVDLMEGERAHSPLLPLTRSLPFAAPVCRIPLSLSPSHFLAPYPARSQIPLKLGLPCGLVLVATTCTYNKALTLRQRWSLACLEDSKPRCASIPYREALAKRFGHIDMVEDG